jgi:hypothetical protein
VALLRRLNPGIPVVGLFGGEGAVRRAAFGSAGTSVLGLDKLYSSREPAAWNWRHSDLLLARWYREIGHTISFDVLHLVEWDLLLMEPLDSLYASVPEETVGLTALTPISDLEDEWTWLRRDETRKEWDALLACAHAEWGYQGIPHGCVGPGSCVPRSFLDAYARLDPPPPALCNDELRLPLFAQILGFPIVDTRLRGPWRGEREDPYFHFRDQEIELSAIKAELARPDGWRAFHPVRARLEPSDILNGR